METLSWDCKTQHYGDKLEPKWYLDKWTEHDFDNDWALVPNNRVFEIAFKRQWELFIRHVVEDEPFPWDFREGAKGVQLTEASHRSWNERRQIAVDELTI